MQQKRNPTTKRYTVSVEQDTEAEEEKLTK